MRLTRYLLALAGGFALTFAYPHWNVGIVAWLWILPVLYALWSERLVQAEKKKSRARHGFKVGYVAGLAFFIPNLAWVRHSSRVIHGAIGNEWMGWGPELMGMGAVVGLSLYVSLYWGFWGAFAATIARPRISADGKPTDGDTGQLFSVSLESLRAAFLTAGMWVACEWLRGIVMTGFGWNGLGVALRQNLSLIQSADIVGVTGLSFLPVFLAAIGYNTVLRFRQEVRTSKVRPHADFFCAIALLLVNWGYGGYHLYRPQPTNTQKLNLLMVQLNLPQGEKFRARATGEGVDEIYQNLAKYTDLFASRVQENKPELVIWPESALPYQFYDPNHIQFLNDVLGMGDFSLLTGTDILQPDEAMYTGAALMRRNYDNHQLYRKVHLVPFGEYLPLREISLVQSLLGNVLPGDFQFGDSTAPLTLENPSGVQIIPLVCFEDTVGRLARKFAREAPQLIVNLTNDGWFLQSEENEVHLSNAIFRCIELRRPMARACNTGVTCLIDSRGIIARGAKLMDSKGSVFTKGVLAKSVLLDKAHGLTFYARYGDVFSIAMLAICGLTIVVAIVNRRKTKALVKST
ncbi:MAG: apolipoprotein N-acyltransferase [Verrucomicrobium sp.]